MNNTLIYSNSTIPLGSGDQILASSISSNKISWHDNKSSIKINKVIIVDIILTVQELQKDKAKLALWLTSANEEERQIAELIAKEENNDK